MCNWWGGQTFIDRHTCTLYLVLGISVHGLLVIIGRNSEEGPAPARNCIWGWSRTFLWGAAGKAICKMLTNSVVSCSNGLALDYTPLKTIYTPWIHLVICHHVHVDFSKEVVIV